MDSPKKPKPTREETLMRDRQVEQIAKLDEEENRRLKGLTRLRFGGRGLLGGAARRAAAGGAGASTSTSPSRAPGSGGSTGPGRAIP